MVTGNLLESKLFNKIKNSVTMMVNLKFQCLVDHGKVLLKTGMLEETGFTLNLKTEMDNGSGLQY